MFLEISRDLRSGKYKNHRYITIEELISQYKFNLDLASWARSARAGSRFGASTTNSNYLYIKTDKMDEEQIKGICG